MRPISKIVIVGGGTSGWLAASMLCHHFKRELCQIQLIESEEFGTIAVAESTVPRFVGLFQRLAINEQGFIPAPKATTNMAIQFVACHRATKNTSLPSAVIHR